MNDFINHIWQSSLFVALVALTTLFMKGQSARVRYWLWFAASVKFLIPFTLLVSLGSRVELEKLPVATTATAVAQISSTFSPAEAGLPKPDTQSRLWWPQAVASLWAAGSVWVLASRVRGWLSIHKAAQSGVRLSIEAPIPVLSTRMSLEPGVFGIFRPVLLLPESIGSALNEQELDAVLAHEFTHVKNRDNLTAAIHIVVETLFWFHPLTWWIGSRMVAERERACDEAVIEQGKAVEVYAQGIVNVCRHYVESPLPCAPGIGGADLKKRISEILSERLIGRMGTVRKLALVLCGLAAIALPLAIGLLRAQTLPPVPQHRFEEASIRKNTSGSGNSRIMPGPQGGLRTENTSVLQFLTFAYDVRDYQLIGVPDWARSDRYDLTGIPDQPEEAPSPTMGRAKIEATFNRHKQRMQALLLERFGLVLKAEQREMSVYGLTVGKNGHKLIEVPDDKKPPNLSTRNGMITGQAIPVPVMATSLSSLLGRPVIDETGLKGSYDFKFEWTPENRAEGSSEADSKGSIFTAIQEQLGLKLDSKKGKAPVFVIEKIEKPTEN